MRQTGSEPLERRLLLLGEGPVAKALALILRDAAKINILPVPYSLGAAGGTDELHHLLNRVGEICSPKGPSLVIACSGDAWRVAGLLNLWCDPQTAFAPIRRASADAPSRSLAVCCIDEPLPADFYAARASGMEPSLATVVEALAKVEERSEVSAELLMKAVRHAYMAGIRHELPSPPSQDPHALHDFIAAVRILQGAFLGDLLSSSEARNACARILHIQQRRGVNLNPDDWANRLILDNTDPHSESPRKKFGTLLVLDDSEVWGRPLNALWERLGFAVVQCEKVDAALEAIDTRSQEGIPVRVALVDIRLHGMRHGGIDAVRRIHRLHRRLPIIVLSVDDQFSETVFLKRLGAFAYLNKHALAERTGGRDAISAVGQLCDALRIASFVSLADDLCRIWEKCRNRMALLMRSEGWPRHFWQQPAWDAAASPPELQILDSRVLRAIEAVTLESGRLFHGYWQDVAYPVGLAARQIIRVMGLVNDQWCSLWKAWRFDPDHPKLDYCWRDDAHIRHPYWFYHKATTALRDEASHSMVGDDDFLWIDAWIMIVATLLKIEGAADACAKRLVRLGVIEEDGHAGRAAWDAFARCLAGVLESSRVLDAATESIERASPEALVGKVTTLSGALRMWLPVPVDAVFPEGDARRISVLPYLCRAGDGHQV